MNGTGPEGLGVMTGRRMGRCTNYGARTKKEESENAENPSIPGDLNIPERGFGFGFGRRRGRGRMCRGDGGQGLRHRHRG
ncbi:MAG: DUF5320 domain-containing protein [Bacteroidales bacterium]|nr:DUF5320 domain-containing protein [Bacteroidales bacterium]